MYASVCFSQHCSGSSSLGGALDAAGGEREAEDDLHLSNDFVHFSGININQ